jgi:glycosyltransferase involved in cell wall biosynthesis
MLLRKRKTDLKTAAERPRPLYPWQLSESRQNTVGVVHPCYGSSHVVYGLDVRRYVYRTLLTAPLKRFDSSSTFFAYTPVILDLSTPLVHTWNSVPMNKDFIVSFELELPRYLGSPTPAQIERGMKILGGERCKAILALSEFAFNHAKREIVQRGYPTLLDKMSLFRGAIQDPLKTLGLVKRSEARGSFRDRALSGILIGTHLFHKGGMYVIQAFENLRAEGFHVELTLIGDFESNAHPFREHLPNADEWRARARQHKWIRFEGPIPNAQVFQELCAHDICLYPSLDESLGWLPIEAGMLGVPVLGNRICAFPEFVSHMKTGWLVDLPLGPHGRWEGIGSSGEQLRSLLGEANKKITAGIEDCLRYVYENPHALEEWGREARLRMMQKYGMEAASRELEQIYDRCLGNHRAM